MSGPLPRGLREPPKLYFMKLEGTEAGVERLPHAGAHKGRVGIADHACKQGNRSAPPPRSRHSGMLAALPATSQSAMSTAEMPKAKARPAEECSFF